MKKISCIIVEDDPVSQKLLEAFCKKHQQIEVLGVADSVEMLQESLVNNRPDFILLDINLPLLNGYQFLELEDNPPQIIVVSGNPENAAKAFDFEATDFLLKPISYERFEKAIDKVTKHQPKLKSSEEDKKYLFIKTKNGYEKICASDILFIEAMGDYVQIVTANKKHVEYTTMKKVEDLLSNFPNIVRVHRSYFVNVDHLKSVDENVILLETGKHIPLSKTYKSLIFDKINTL
jgi:DNA-binding LytR/AlgR family response regulator